MSREFYELCYDQYSREMEEADRMYQKAGVMLVAIPLLGMVTVALGRMDILRFCLNRADIFLFYLASIVAILSLTISVVFLILFIYPRKYATLGSMDLWHQWRDDYRKYLKSREASDKVDCIAELDLALLDNVCLRIVEAQPVNSDINETRREAFKKTIIAVAISLVAIGFQALFYLILKVQGV